MKRLARLAAAAGLCAASLVTARQAAVATPFSDVPANHWAYQYIQSLAADGVIDGYPDGKFKGDRPLTRYEMATVVARTIAKLQENQGQGASKEDLDKLQKLIDALKDELDGLGVRVTNLEDSLDALDKRTKFAQSLSLHGVFLPNVTFRQRTLIPRTVTPAVAGEPAVAQVDPFVTAFLTTDDTNNPITQAGSDIRIRQDTRFSLAYQINDNLTVSLPVHILNLEFGGDFSQQAKFDIEPGVDINIAKAGALSNVDFKFGIIDNLSSSRTGLTFKAPQGYNGQVPYALPFQPFQKGVSVKGTIGEGAFGLTDFEGSFTRLDNTLYDTQTGNIDPNVLPLSFNAYLFPVVPPQAGFTQTTGAGTLQTDTFSSGNGPLQQVFLRQKAVNGSVYISSYNGETYNSAGQQIGGPTVGAAPTFTYNEAYNSIVFGVALPAGSVVGITYKGLTVTNNTGFERYMAHGRLNQKFKGYNGLEVGLTYNRIFDYDDTETSGLGPNAITAVFQNAVTGLGEVSDTVVGADFQAPLPFNILGPGSQPVIFGEASDSKFTPDYRNLAATGDTAGLIGLRLKIAKVELSAQYQSVGANFFVGAPFHYYGNAPATFADYKGGYFPDFFGFGNNLGINQQFDAQFTRLGLASPNSASNSGLTFVYPIFNTLKASGPQYFSAFAPNTRGEAVSLNTPVRIGDFNFTTRASYQHLEEIRPNSYNANFFGPEFLSNQREQYDTYTVGTAFTLPAFGQKETTNLSATYETLRRLDRTAQQYYPINLGTQQFDTASFTAANAAFPTGGTYGGGSGVSFYPNYVNARHLIISAAASLPVTRDLALSGTYSTQRYGGAYGTTLTQNISERKDYYTGAITYSVPKTNSSLSFVARHYNYTDDVIPNTNLGENRQDINFTIRF